MIDVECHQIKPRMNKGLRGFFDLKKIGEMSVNYKRFLFAAGLSFSPLFSFAVKAMLIAWQWRQNCLFSFVLLCFCPQVLFCGISSKACGFAYRGSNPEPSEFFYVCFLP
jgi:hypothetical protein